MTNYRTPSRWVLALAVMTNWLPAAQAGHIAGATANAAVRELQGSSYVDIQPWAFSVQDGNTLVSNGRSNTQAEAINGPHRGVSGRTADSYAAADLATGTLRASASAFNAVNTPLRPFAAVAFGAALFGDSFHVQGANNAPFDWASGGNLSFGMHLDGRLFNDPGVSPPSFNLFLTLYRPGTVGTSRYDASQKLGAVGWNSSTNAVTGVTTLRAGTDNSTSPVQIAHSTTGSLSGGGYDLEASFNPGGDFDWTLELWATAFINQGLGASVSDFSHTVTTSYRGPASSITTSSSGVFAGTVPAVMSAVPEPGTAALSLLGLAALTLRLRGRGAATRKSLP
ncbi:exported hypothetical protein [Rubrivivax sp. A210]|uniref:hypothetical protein n=1 Tax=Rubrivivax sp. A210 TaxID=2772301 RepID=UPI0019188615|nr:hypothetical protein [Rubrivivax sp. A210]CAD5370619.1 exported hypothetical protein [Rubrivivax sp. A210]